MSLLTKLRTLKDRRSEIVDEWDALTKDYKVICFGGRNGADRIYLNGSGPEGFTADKATLLLEELARALGYNLIQFEYCGEKQS